MAMLGTTDGVPAFPSPMSDLTTYMDLALRWVAVRLRDCVSISIFADNMSLVLIARLVGKCSRPQSPSCEEFIYLRVQVHELISY